MIWQPVLRVRRQRERAVFRQVKAGIPQAIRASTRFTNEDSAERGPSQRSPTFAVGCKGLRCSSI